MSTQKSLLILCALAASTAFAGCSSVVPFSEESRRWVRSVTIRADGPVEASYQGRLPGLYNDTRGSVWYSSVLTAPVGVAYDLIDWGENQERRSESFQHRLHKLDVDVPAMVRLEFTRHVEGSRMFDSVRNGEGDASFDLDIRYGLTDTMGLRGGWKPWLVVEGKLIDREGTVLWRQEAEVSAYDERIPEVDRPLGQPKYLGCAFRNAAKMVAAKLVRHLMTER